MQGDAVRGAGGGGQRAPQRAQVLRDSVRLREGEWVRFAFFIQAGIECTLWSRQFPLKIFACESSG